MIHNKTIFVLVLMGLIGLITLANATVDTAWTRRYSSPGSLSDTPKAMAVDSAGSVYVVGSHNGTLTNWLVRKYNTNGDLQWFDSYASSSSDRAWSVAYAPSGHLYVAGSGYGGISSNRNYITMKYDATTGQRIWTKVYNYGTGGDDAYMVVLDNAENVYVTGIFYGANSVNEYGTIKYDSAGNQLWVKTYRSPGAGPYPATYSSEASAIAVDNAGYVYVTGKSQVGGSGIAYRDYLTIKYNATNGDTVWTRRYDPAGTEDNANAIRVDALGNVYITGSSQSNATTIKYGANGDQIWVRQSSGNGSWIELFGEYLYVYGNTWVNGTSTDLLLVKYDTSGVEQWVQTYNGPNMVGTNYSYDVAGDGQPPMVLDTLGNIYLSARSTYNGAPLNTYCDIITLKYNSAGTQQWTIRYNHPLLDTMHQGVAIGLDKNNNVYATGYGRGVGTGTYIDWVTIKYTQGAPSSYTITANAYGPGTIIPSGSVLVIEGNDTTFVITPNVGAHLDSLIVDGFNHGADSISYTFEDVTSDHTIDAYFSIDTYTILATTTTGGTITPSDTVIIEYGADTTFEISANTDYVLDSVLVDGVSVGAVTSYPFTGVDADHTIHAMFTMTAIPGWAQKESVVTPHIDKTIKDGGALVGVPGTGKDPAKLYAFLGTKTNRFKMYTVGTGWSESDSLLFAHKYKPATYTVDTVKFAKKFPGKGAAMCFDGDHTIYATKGNGTNEFFVYDMTSDAGWTAKAFVPTLKGLKGGTSIRWFDGKVYLMAGGQKKDPTVNNFWVYEPTADSVGGIPWTALGKLPLGPNTKVWKDGASIIEVGGTFYAVKSADKTNLFYAYDWGTSTWLDKEPIPIDDSSYHKYKKKLIVKDGAATATDGSVIYATKGGGTEVFWKYTPGTTGVWERLDRLPIEKADKKHAPKTGAAMTFVDGKVWLLVGNKQVDFWCYVPTAAKSEKRIANSVNNVIARSAQTNAAISNFSITPNPFSKLTTIRYTVPISGKVSLKLYNSTGRLIETLVNTNLDAGSYTSTLSTIAKGVYFLKYESNTNKTEVKLIVQ